tara:strand:- start:358 stop:651 length:294 start_codon:yes stop_codon:yes gene_type:complete
MNNELPITPKVGMTLSELPTQRKFGPKRRHDFYDKGWDRMMMDAPNQWVCLRVKTMQSGYFWTIAKEYNAKFGHLGFEFKAMSLDGQRTLWGKYTTK